MSTVHTYDKKTPPDPLPDSLPDGTLTTLHEDPFRLVGVARRDGQNYYGGWVRDHGAKGSSFVAACLVDWDHWREPREIQSSAHFAGGVQVDVIDGAAKCSCCGERDADHTFPGLTEQHRDLAGRPISTRCSLEIGSARMMAQRIRVRDAATGRINPDNYNVFACGQELTPIAADAVERRTGKPIY